jgi:SAM-dependent methyltransferase
VTDHVKAYFDRHARAWIEQAYVDERLPAKFPVASERIRIALTSIAGPASDGATLIDLGCGGGQLLAHAAQLGWRAVGVDIAPGMVEEARRATAGLDVRLIEAAYDESGLESGSADAVTALGLIEYLPDDSGLLAEAARLLRPGGRFAVSCRNRLYNMLSANAHTERELAGGAAPALLDELRGALEHVRTSDLNALARELAAAARDLERAVELDDDGTEVPQQDHPAQFGGERRQHSPRELRRFAQDAGLTEVALFPIHPHPLPPATEPLAPHVYNRLALSWQRALGDSALGLAFCTAFVATFEKER